MTAIKLAHLTSPEAREVGARGDAIGLIGVGALEQHGAHLPMIMDSWHAERLGEEIAARIDSPVVIVPVLAPGLSDPHIDFPGTVTLREEVFHGLLDAYVEALGRIGVRRVALFSGHGSNYRSLGEYAKAYTASHPGTEVISHETMDELTRFLFEGAHAAGLEPVPSDVHAGLIETSVALHIFDRELIRDFSDVHGWATSEDGWLQRLLTEGLPAVSPSGVLGDPAGATAEAGAVIFDAVVEGFADWICASFSLQRA